MMDALYDVGVRTINEDIKKVYADYELMEKATIRKFRIVHIFSNPLYRVLSQLSRM